MRAIDKVVASFYVATSKALVESSKAPHFIGPHENLFQDYYQKVWLPLLKTGSSSFD